MTAIYEKPGLRFQYPDNWELEEDEASPGQNAATVHNPGGGFWSVAVRSPFADPQELIAETVQAMRAEYSAVETDDCQETIVGHEAIGCDLNFFYLDLTNTAWVRCIRTPEATFVIFAQADDREFEKVEPIFRAMTISLLRDQTG